MKAKQILFAAAIAAALPFAAQAESPFAGITPVQEPTSTLTRAEVREEFLAQDRDVQNYGEAYPYLVSDPMTMRLLAEVRREALMVSHVYGEVTHMTHN